MADALELLGASAWAGGQYMRTRSQLEEAATLYQELGEQWKYDRCLGKPAASNANFFTPTWL